MLLFIDTHDMLITIAIKNGDDLFIKTKESEYSHSKFVMPMIKEVFEENNLDIHNLDEILVVNGPGSFTGIRIGLTIAKTIAYSLNIKIKCISSLTAYLVSSGLSDDKMCVIEDNKGYYISVFDKNNNVIVPECYVTSNEYDYELVENKLDVLKVIDYSENINYENYYHVKANYVKEIEVEK